MPDNNKDAVSRREYVDTINNLRGEHTDAMNRIFDKMETHHRDINENITRIAMDMAQMRATVNAINIPNQPCETLKEHIKDQKEMKKSWRNPVIVGIIVTLFLFVQEPIKSFISRIFGQ